MIVTRYIIDICKSTIYYIARLLEVASTGKEVHSTGIEVHKHCKKSDEYTKQELTSMIDEYTKQELTSMIDEYTKQELTSMSDEYTKQELTSMIDRLLRKPVTLQENRFLLNNTVTASRLQSHSPATVYHLSQIKPSIDRLGIMRLFRYADISDKFKMMESKTRESKSSGTKLNIKRVPEVHSLGIEDRLFDFKDLMKKFTTKN